MKITLILIGFIFLNFDQTYCQVAIIQDKDGYTNVREKPDIQSKILYKLHDNEVFFYYDETFDSQDSNNDWINVMIPVSKFSIQRVNENDIYGYIHKSRLKPLNELETIENPNKQLIFTIGKIDNSVRSVMNDSIEPKGGQYLYQLTQVKKIDLKWEDEIIPLSKMLFQDLNNMTNKTGELKSSSIGFKTYRKDNVYFIHQKCGDGEYYYEIVWVLENKKIVQRLAGWIY